MEQRGSPQLQYADFCIKRRERGYAFAASKPEATVGAAARYFNQWIDRSKWQRRKPMEELVRMLLRHREGLLNDCQVFVKDFDFD